MKGFLLSQALSILIFSYLHVLSLVLRVLTRSGSAEPGAIVNNEYDIKNTDVYLFFLKIRVKSDMFQTKTSGVNYAKGLSELF